MTRAVRRSAWLEGWPEANVVKDERVAYDLVRIKSPETFERDRARLRAVIEGTDPSDG